MRVLILGSGAREHAIARVLAVEGHDLTVAPGNAGIATLARIAPVEADDPAAAVALATSTAPDLVVIGPEAPLVAGVADALRAEGFAVFGPDATAARIEGSKGFAKRIMDAAGVPTGRAVEVLTADGSDDALDATGSPYVVKADGLAAGKGVLVTTDRAAARAHVLRWLEEGPVLVEEHLAGREVSLFFVCDGATALPLTPAQDFKRLLDGDAGPNTGGMGAYSPLPWLAEEFGDEAAFCDLVRRTVVEPVLIRMAAEDSPFIGLLYCGLIVDGAEVRVIEFNARFGDPETQVVLPRLATPLGALLRDAALGLLDPSDAPGFRPDAAVGIVVASAGYPAAPRTGLPIDGIAAAEEQDGVHVDHAGTVDLDGTLTTTGGRVLTVVGTGPTVSAARGRATAGVARIRLAGEQHRTDIAAGVP